ncbi:MAG: hypothetical protein BV458_13260 [Thermoplasmata archaeon M9B2D]|nr:MAG: hypothetical protein BV458_13260 [Thermoplasmata archaeon M9B2D]
MVVSQPKENIRLFLGDVQDKHREEMFNILLFNDPRAVRVHHQSDADYILCDAITIRKRPKLPENIKLIILSPSDLYLANVGLRVEDVEWRKYLNKINATMIWIVVETIPSHHSGKYATGKPIRLFGTEGNLIVLTMPMGYFTGSKMNINYPFNDTSTFFRKNWQENAKHYERDWCFIATESCENRTVVKKILEQRNTGFLSVSKPYLNDIEENGGIQKRMYHIHADNKAVPYDEFLKISKSSKVNISCNGLGMWCFKDAEMLAYNCFVLRQYHRNLNINPLSPVDGKHWVTFKNDELEDKLDYYIKNDAERERINDTGHTYFKDAITQKWSQAYLDALLLFENTGDTKSFGGLMYVSNS